MADTRTIKKTNICFDCEKAVGGCSWARDFIPPEGCTYEPIYDTRKNGGGVMIGAYISACPLFEQSPHRHSVGILSDTDNERFLEEHARPGRPRKYTSMK